MDRLHWESKQLSYNFIKRAAVRNGVFTLARGAGAYVGYSYFKDQAAQKQRSHEMSIDQSIKTSEETILSGKAKTPIEGECLSEAQKKAINALLPPELINGKVHVTEQTVGIDTQNYIDCLNAQKSNNVAGSENLLAFGAAALGFYFTAKSGRKTFRHGMNALKIRSERDI